jgi:hypothetical protein
MLPEGQTEMSCQLTGTGSPYGPEKGSDRITALATICLAIASDATKYSTVSVHG